MVKTESLWEGKVEIDDLLVSMNYFKNESYNVQQTLIDSIWNDYKVKYPSAYDGSLVLLENFEIEEKFVCGSELLTLQLGCIDFSSFIAMKESNIPFNNVYGILGTQCAIFSPDKKFILVGQRNRNQYYSPGLLTIPGGIVETQDVQTNGLLSLLREIQEEVKISIKNAKIKTILREHSNYSTILFMTAELNQDFDKNENFVGNSEWEDNKLFWLSIDDLKNISEDELMEGLTYLKRQTVH